MAARSRRPPASRLDRRAWLDAALGALAEGGVEAVRVEPLAAALGVTKGSFYWHFADHAALLAALRDDWRDGRVAAIAAQAAASDDPAEAAGRLRRLLALHLDRRNPRGLAIELAMRDWARRDAAAAGAVAAVDRARLAALRPLFAALGHAPADADARAVTLYGFLFGQALLAPTAGAAARRRLRDRCAALLIG